MNKTERCTFTKEFKLDVIQQSYQRENIRELADFEAIAPSFGSAGTDIKGILKNEPGDGAGQRLPIVETPIVFCRYFNIDTTLVQMYGWNECFCNWGSICSTASTSTLTSAIFKRLPTQQ
ncbi:MAG: hypothetical protein WD059_13465 [Balneolaceae bacterium]